eukprot:jgi/Mesvir1/28037/Mv24227-RA.1
MNAGEKLDAYAVVQKTRIPTATRQIDIRVILMVACENPRKDSRLPRSNYMQPGFTAASPAGNAECHARPGCSTRHRVTDAGAPYAIRSYRVVRSVQPATDNHKVCGVCGLDADMQAEMDRLRAKYQQKPDGTWDCHEVKQYAEPATQPSASKIGADVKVCGRCQGSGEEVEHYEYRVMRSECRDCKGGGVVRMHGFEMQPVVDDGGYGHKGAADWPVHYEMGYAYMHVLYRQPTNDENIVLLQRRDGVDNESTAKLGTAAKEISHRRVQMCGDTTRSASRSMRPVARACQGAAPNRCG